MIGGQSKTSWMPFAVVFAAAALFMLLRTQDLNPRIFADEYTYSYHAKFFGEVDSGIPSFLYYAVYNIASLCGDELLACARYINIAFYLFGGLFVYLTGRSWLDERSNLLVTAASVFGPYSIYTHFFMPESMFYFGFWLFIYLFSRIETGHLTSYLWASVALGVLSLIKPHAILFIPACLVYIVLIEARASHAVRNGTIFLITAVATKMVLGYLLVGTIGITFFGDNYSSHATSVLSNPDIVFKIWTSIVANLLGNVAALVFVYGLCLPILVAGFFRGFKKASNIQILATLLLINLLVVVVAFTSTVPVFENNQDFRIYFRYYGFVFPLLFISTVVSLDQNKLEKGFLSTQLTFSLALVLLASTFYLFLSRHNTLYPYNVFISDIPELSFLMQYEFVFTAYGLLSVAILLLFFVNTSKMKHWFLAYLSLTTFILALLSISKTREDLIPGAADNAGIYLRNNLSTGAQDSLLVVGQREFQLQNVLFYSSSPNAKLFVVEPGASLVTSNIPSDHRYVLILGDVPYEGNLDLVDDGAGFGLYKIGSSVK